MKKKLLITTDNFLPRWDGISRTLLEIIPKLKEKYSITLIAPKFPGRIPSFKGVKIIRIPLSRMHFADYTLAKIEYRKIEAEVKENDIVFNQTIGPIGFLSITAAKKHKKPVISYIHSIEWELFSKAVKSFKKTVYIMSRIYARYCYRRCSLLLIPSKETGDVLAANRINTPVRIAHLGTDVAKFIPPLDKKKAKTAVGISPKSWVIGFCGRIGREKGISTLYNAFKKVSMVHKNVVLLVVGSGLKETEEALLNQKNVIAAGSKDNVVPYLQAMDAFVLPSLTETTSIATLEAMSCGLAVVVTPVGYVKKYVKNGVNGLFFPKKNSGVLANKINTLMKNEKLVQRLGAAARKTVIHDFNWEKTVKGIIESIESLC